MKELQGQFKTDFEKFVTDNYHNTILCVDPNSIIQNFNSLKIEFQFGVVQLFADNVEYKIDRVYEDCVFEFDTWIRTRPEAQQEAITQFEKWYNENK